MSERRSSPSLQRIPRVLLILAIMIQIALCLVTVERRFNPVPSPPLEPPTSLVQKQAGEPVVVASGAPLAKP